MGAVYVDMILYALVFVSAWTIYFFVYLVAAKLRWIANLELRLVSMGVVCALAAGLASGILLEPYFSSASTFWMATLTAPIAFLGFCAVFILNGPAVVDRSISMTVLRTVKNLEESHNPSLRLIDSVPFERIFNKRVRELSSGGLIEASGSGFRVTRLGNRTLKFFDWLGRRLNVQWQ